MCCLSTLIAEKWQSGKYFEEGIEIPQHPWKGDHRLRLYGAEVYDFTNIVPNLHHRFILPIESVPNLSAVAVVKLMQWTSEVKHYHPASDRVFTIMEGQGAFFTRHTDKIVKLYVRPGCRIWLPRNTQHFFEVPYAIPLVMEVHQIPPLAEEDPQFSIKGEPR